MPYEQTTYEDSMPGYVLIEKINKEMEKLERETERLRDVDAAAKAACAAYLSREERPGCLSEAMKSLYWCTREDLWEKRNVR